MKANQFAKTEDGVSPVIGVILMVAITVVLAAVVFVLVSNLSDTKDQAPDIGFAKDESADRINVISTDSGLNWDDFAMIADDATGGYILNANVPTAAGTTVTGAGQQTAFGSATLAAGNFLGICGANGMTVKIVHIETNTQVYETTFNTLADANCAAA